MLVIAIIIYFLMIETIYLIYDPSHWYLAIVLTIACPLAGLVGGWLGYQLSRW